LRTAQVVAVSDTRPDRLALAGRRYPGICVTTNPSDLIADPTVDAVVIATPVQHHFDLAMLALRAGTSSSRSQSPRPRSRRPA
jgi:predicted dehydrogenase